MICFQLCSYYLWLTTLWLCKEICPSCDLLSTLFLLSLTYNATCTGAKYWMLWFAFNFVLTIFDLQHRSKRFNRFLVVICFQLCSYYLWLTTFVILSKTDFELWFAFNFVLTIFDLQQKPYFFMSMYSCDLLSTLFLLSLTYNRYGQTTRQLFVVICFQLCSYYLWLTTKHKVQFPKIELWFAFNFVLTIFDLQH